jgi:hypothetical protein
MVQPINDLDFHPQMSILISGAKDHTIKYVIVAFFFQWTSSCFTTNSCCYIRFSHVMMLRSYEFIQCQATLSKSGLSPACAGSLILQNLQLGELFV